MLANVLNFAILIVGTTATAAAFGGKTWKEGEDPILKRITARGWVSLACLLLAFILGSSKQVVDDHDRRRATDKHDAENRTNAQEIAYMRAQLAVSHQTIIGLSDKSDVQAKNLKDARESIGYLRGDQQAAREDVVRSDNLNLMAAVAGGDRRVVDSTVAVPLTKTGVQALTVSESLLPAFTIPKCRERTYVKVTVAGGSELPVELRYAASDFEHFHYRKGLGHHGPEAADQLLRSDELAQPLAAEVGQTSTDGTLYVATLHDTRERQSGSEFLAYLLRRGLQAPKPGSNREDSNILTLSVGDLTLSGAAGRLYPTSCGKEVYR